MTIRAFLRVASVAAVGIGLVAASSSMAAFGTAPLAAADYTKYHTYDEMTAALRDLAKTHGNLAKLVEVAKTREGRTIWAIEIANPAGTPIAERPAMLIAANFEGDQLIGSELALYVAEQLLTGYAGNATIKSRLESHAFYIVPRVNADGAEAMFGAIKSARKMNSAKNDADNDGRLDEDGPEDLNKDGFITVMRVKDPKGVYMVHPDDARLLRRVRHHRRSPVHRQNLAEPGSGRSSVRLRCSRWQRQPGRRSKPPPVRQPRSAVRSGCRSHRR